MVLWRTIATDLLKNNFAPKIKPVNKKYKNLKTMLDYRYSLWQNAAKRYVDGGDMFKKSKISQDVKEVLYGLILLSIFVVAFIVMAEKQHDPKSVMGDEGFLLYADFGRTNGLHSGDDVRISGINVGKVLSAELKNNYRVTLTMLLDKNYNIPDDSSAAIESDAIMGKKYVDISLGGADDTIPYAGTILYTQDAMVLEELINLVISYAKSKQK